jgi:hypothetical protein
LPSKVAPTAAIPRWPADRSPRVFEEPVDQLGVVYD